MQLTFSKAILLSLGFVLISLTSFSQKQLYIVTTDTGSVVNQFDSTTMGPKLNIKIDASLLNSNSNQKIKIVLPNGSPKGIVVNAIKKKQESSPNQFAWYGQIENQPKSFVLITQVKDAIAAHIRTNDDKIFRITYIGNGVHQIRVIDQRFFKADYFDLISSFDPLKNNELLKETASCCDGSVIDALVVYTPAAIRAAGGLSGIDSRINECINQTNESFINSNIPGRIQLIHSAMVQYQESGSVESDRDALRDSTDGKMDGIHALRNLYHADVVVLLVKDANLSGVGYIMGNPQPAFESYAFCVVRLDDAFSNLSFAHEIGHLMGSNHECNATPITQQLSFPYSHGYSIDLNRTIMSTNLSAARKEFWSDPKINFIGTTIPTGSIAGDCQAMDAECLRHTIAIVSKFRCGQRCITTEPSSTTPSSFVGPQESTITANSTIEPPSNSTIEPTVTPDPLGSSSTKHSNSWIIIVAAVIILALIFWFILKRKKDS